MFTWRRQAGAGVPEEPLCHRVAHAGGYQSREGRGGTREGNRLRGKKVREDQDGAPLGMPDLRIEKFGCAEMTGRVAKADPRLRQG